MTIKIKRQNIIFTFYRCSAFVPGLRAAIASPSQSRSTLVAILMTDTSNYIRTGFFADFKGYDTVLISADINGLLEIENAFAQLSQGLSFLDLSKLRHLDEKFHVDIKAHSDTINSGLKQIDKGKFEWRLTKNKWHQFREMVTALYRLGTGGHQYLDVETSNIDLDSLQVVLSLNEYPLSFWQEHFETCNS